MRKAFTTLLALMAFNLLFSQSLLSERIFIEKKIPATLSELDSIDTEGTPYFNPEFTKGSFTVGNTSYIADMRYNIYIEMIEVQQGNTIVYLNPALKPKISMGEKTFVYLNYPEKTMVYELLASQKNAMLVKKHQIEYIPIKWNKNGSIKKYPVYKKTNPAIYLSPDQKELFNVEKTTDFISLFPREKENIKNFIKQEKLKKKKEADLIKLFNYVAGLTEANHR